jgi:alkylation response protein AidB-like acyl-CoA dehydrogenase
MAFFQTPPSLGNQYEDDWLLRSYLTRVLPAAMFDRIAPELSRLGQIAGTELYERQIAEYRDEPRLTQWDAWGNRVDRIEVTPLWKRAAVIAAEEGLVGIPTERKDGEHSRIHQMAKVYLFDASSGVYTCPLAMTDGATKALTVSGNGALIERAVPRLTSRDPAKAWTSGQWMTERTGGSDVGRSETVAKKDGDVWRLYGTKWFTSAITSQMAITLARPEGNPPGGSGLAMFYVEIQDDAGRIAEGLYVNRLKDKLGTRMVPTAELTLDGLRAVPVIGLKDGIKAVTPVLGVARLWNAVSSIAAMRRGLALVRDYAKRRVAFGLPLSEQPLHADTVAMMEAEVQGAFLLTFRVVELLGREETGVATEEELMVLRLITPIAKLTTGKQAVAVTSEALEAFGGAGYVEDTGLPRLLRDAQVLPIWEGTTNVLSLDVLRGLDRNGSALGALERELRRAMGDAGGRLAAPRDAALSALGHAVQWFAAAAAKDRQTVEAGARRFGLTLGRSIELALLVGHAAHCAKQGELRPTAAALRLAKSVDLIVDDFTIDDAATLMQ